MHKNKEQGKRNEYLLEEIRISAYLSKTTKCSVYTPKYSGEDSIPNLSVHEIYLDGIIKRLNKGAQQTCIKGPAKDYTGTYNNDGSPECNHYSNVVFC